MTSSKDVHNDLMHLLPSSGDIDKLIKDHMASNDYRKKRAAVWKSFDDTISKSKSNIDEVKLGSDAAREIIRALRALDVIPLAELVKESDCDKQELLRDLLNLTHCQVEEVRWRAIRKIGQAKTSLSEEQVQSISQKKDDPSWRVRAQAFYTIALAGSKRATPHLEEAMEAMRDEMWVVRGAAVEALMGMEYKHLQENFKSLESFSRTESDAVIKRKLQDIMTGAFTLEASTKEASGQSGDRNPVEELKSLMHYESFGSLLVRKWAQDHLFLLKTLDQEMATHGFVETPAPLPREHGGIAEKLASKKASRRIEGLAEVAKLKDFSADFIPGLAYIVLKDPDPEVRKEAALTFGDTFHVGESCAHLLALALDDPDPRVVEAARSSFALMSEAASLCLVQHIFQSDEVSRTRIILLQALECVRGFPEDVKCAFLCEWAACPQAPVPLRGAKVIAKEGLNTDFPYYIVHGGSGTIFVVFTNEGKLDGQDESFGWLSVYRKYGFKPQLIASQQMFAPPKLWDALCKSIWSAHESILNKKLIDGGTNLCVCGYSQGGLAAQAMAICSVNGRCENYDFKLLARSLTFVSFGAPNFIGVSFPAMKKLADRLRYKINHLDIAFKTFCIDKDPRPAITSSRVQHVFDFFRSAGGYFYTHAGSEALTYAIRDTDIKYCEALGTPFTPTILKTPEGKAQVDTLFTSHGCPTVADYTKAICRDAFLYGGVDMCNYCSGMASAEERRLLQTVWLAWVESRTAGYEAEEENQP